MHKTSVRLMAMFRNNYLADMKGCTVLDIGSRSSDESEFTYRQLFEPDYVYTGMDIVPGLNVDKVGYESIEGEVYDVVISGQVMEHVKHPWDWLKMLKNYYRTYICIIAPHHWREHRHPYDTYRYFPDGMRDLFEYAGIREVYIARGKNDTIGIGGK